MVGRMSTTTHPNLHNVDKFWFIIGEKHLQSYHYLHKRIKNELLKSQHQAYIKQYTKLVFVHSLKDTFSPKSHSQASDNGFVGQ